MREDQTRYTATKIQPLEQALESKIRQIQIHMEQGTPALKIKELLDVEGSGMAEIILNVHIDQNRIAKIKLPGRWSLNAKARNTIRVEEGVQEILEA